MTEKEVKQYLSSYIATDQRIQALIQEYEKWESIGTKISQSYNPTPGGSDNTSKPERAAVEMARIKNKIQREIVKSIAERDKVKKTIDKVKIKRYTVILTYRYINGLSVNEISNIIGKDARTVARALNNAHKEVEKII